MQDSPLHPKHAEHDPAADARIGYRRAYEAAQSDPGRGVVALDLEAREVAWTFAPGVTLPAWGYDGRIPGPVIEARVGDVLEHAKYEQSKAFITRRLAERGYFDADFAARKVEVTRAEKAADIDLRWDSGDRYAMGEIVFEQGKPVVGLHVLGAGELELVKDGKVERKLGPGDLLYASAVLAHEPAPALARASASGALLLYWDRMATHELVVSVPPLLELIAMS